MPLPLPLTLAARLTPVVVLAVAGWAMTSGPLAAAPSAEPEALRETVAPSPSPSAPASQAAPTTYTTAPEPCEALTEETVSSLVPGAEPEGKEIPSLDASVRRVCSWNALDGYEYRWLDISFEVARSDEAARTSYEERAEERSGGGEVPGVGDAAYSVVNLTEEDGQETREGAVLVRVANAVVVVTYDGSDFETGKAPDTEEINKGAILAAKEAVEALGDADSG
ncbi:hypothetical protein AAH978_04165 [Streptomyces sp. ZYX-F-203]